MIDFPLAKAFTQLEPGLVVLVSISDGRRHNVMTITWTMVLDFTPRFAITSGPWNHSYAALEKSRECVIAVPTVDLIDTVLAVGTCSGLDVDKSHRRALQRFADCSRVGRVVLAAAPAHAVGHDELGCHQPHRVAELLEAARPVVRTRTGFHADGAWRQLGHRFEQLVAAHRRAHQRRPAALVDTVQGKHVLGQIDAEKQNRHGHFLASAGWRMRLRNPIVVPGSRPCLRDNLGRAGRYGDVPFIR